MLCGIDDDANAEPKDIEPKLQRFECLEILPIACTGSEGEGVKSNGHRIETSLEENETSTGIWKEGSVCDKPNNPNTWKKTAAELLKAPTER